MEGQFGSFKIKKLYRSKIDRIIAGVCGGFAEYFNIDATIVRVIWLVILFLTGVWLGLLIYLACIIIMKDNPGQSFADKKPQSTALYWGLGLVLLGFVLLSSRWNWDMFYFRPFHWNFFRPWFSNWDRFWPVILILFGVFYLVYVMRQGKQTTDSDAEAIDPAQPSEMPSQVTRLFRARDEKIIGGVCGGIAKNLNIDPVIIRIVWVIFSLISWVMLGVVVYIAWMIIVPEEPIVPRQEPAPATEQPEKIVKKTPRRVKKVIDKEDQEAKE